MNSRTRETLLAADGLTNQKSRSLRDRWLDSLEGTGPRGIGARGPSGGIQDAYRHYRTAAALSRLLGPIGFVGAAGVGGVSEVIAIMRGKNTSAEGLMDIWNNIEGAKDGLGSDSSFQDAGNFAVDVANGEITITDDLNHTRPSDVRDIGGYNDSSVEGKYPPEHSKTMEA